MGELAEANPFLFNPSDDSTTDQAFLPSSLFTFDDSLSNDLDTLFPLQSDPDDIAFFETNERAEGGDLMAFIGGLDDPNLQLSLFSED